MICVPLQVAKFFLNKESFLWDSTNLLSVAASGNSYLMLDPFVSDGPFELSKFSFRLQPHIVPLKWPPRSELRSIINKRPSMPCPSMYYMCKNDLVFSLIDSFLAPRDYFFLREPLDQSEISAFPQSKLKRLSWASRTCPLASRAPFLLAPISSKRPLSRLNFKGKILVVILCPTQRKNRGRGCYKHLPF